MVKKIELTQGKYTIVDDEDYEFLNQWQWHVNRKKCKTSSDLLYAKRFEKRKTITMHRLILNAPKGMDVDHINGNGVKERKTKSWWIFRRYLLSLSDTELFSTYQILCANCNQIKRIENGEL